MTQRHILIVILTYIFLLLQACASEQVQLEPRVVNPMGLSGKLSTEAELYYSQARILWSEQRLALKAEGEVCRNPQKAIELLTKCIALEPTYAAAYVRRAMAYNELEQYHTAFTDITTALRLEPKAEYYAIRSTSLLHMGRLEGARKDINRALDKNSNSAFIWRAAASVSFAENNGEQACQELEKACSYGDCSSLQQAQQKEQCPR